MTGVLRNSPLATEGTASVYFSSHGDETLMRLSSRQLAQDLQTLQRNTIPQEHIGSQRNTWNTREYPTLKTLNSSNAFTLLQKPLKKCFKCFPNDTRYSFFSRIFLLQYKYTCPDKDFPNKRRLKYSLYFLRDCIEVFLNITSFNLNMQLNLFIYLISNQTVHFVIIIKIFKFFPLSLSSL